jgi:hypothetical protein
MFFGRQMIKIHPKNYQLFYCLFFLLLPFYFLLDLMELFNDEYYMRRAPSGGKTGLPRRRNTGWGGCGFAKPNHCPHKRPQYNANPHTLSLCLVFSLHVKYFTIMLLEWMSCWKKYQSC